MDEKNEQKVLKLKKALSVLRQATRAWNSKLDSTSLSLGFKRSPSEHAVYKRGTGSSSLLVGVHVDDLIITGAHPQEISKFKEEMQKLFSMSDLGLLNYYLGIEVHQRGDGDDRNSTTGVLYLLGKIRLISWQSQKQNVAALSSYEVEYITATAAACKVYG